VEKPIRDTEKINNSEREISAKRTFSQTFRLGFVALILATIAYGFGFSQGQTKAWNDEAPILPLRDTAVVNTGSEAHSLDFSLFWRVWNTLEEKYVDANELDARELMYGAIDGMLQASGDPYTAFLDPKANESFDESMAGQFEGIGAELEMRNDLITVVAPLADTPADRAGLRAGDIVVEVNGEDVTDTSLLESVSKMRGPKGTEVILGVYREGSNEQINIAIVRDTIRITSVELEMRDQTAVIAVRQFGDNTLLEFRSALSRALNSGASSLVLDLRNNPGGYLATAVDMAGFFLPNNSVVVIEEDGSGNRKEERSREVSQTKQVSALPTAVIINRGSASASEILAGALAFHREDVVIVGERSFGKGSVQELVPLPQNTAAKITVARWLTPGGEHIDEKGIEPKIEVERSEEDYRENRDPQLDRALEAVREIF
jgi:carboxyl-terminal processing protease